MAHNKRLQVEGYKGLEKDPATSAVVNTDRDALKLAKESKRKALEDKNRIATLEERVAILEKVILDMANKK